MNNQGMSYIEVLIASAVLGIFLFPIVTGFHSAVVQYQQGRQSYEASLLLKNLLVETEQAILRKRGGEMGSEEGIGEWIGNASFATEYRTDVYTYLITITDLDGEEICVLGAKEQQSGTVVLAGDQDSLGGSVDGWVADEVVLFSENGVEESGGFAKFVGQQCTIVVPHDFGKDFLAECRLGENMVDVVLVNESSRNVQIHFFGAQEYVTFTYFSPNGQVVASYYEPPESQAFLMRIEIFDAKRLLRLNQVVKLIGRE